MIRSKSKMSLVLIVLLVLSLTTIGAQTRNAQTLLEGSYAYEQDGFFFVHLEGTPFQIGYQNGYLAHESLNSLLVLYSADAEYWEIERGIAQQFVWDKIPAEYQAEIEGIVAAIQARGYSWDKWDIVAVNGWADQDEVYWDLYEQSLKEKETEEKGGCSAFIAAGDATTDGQIVIGHDTWYSYSDGQHWDVIFDVAPEKGYRFRYQGAGGVLWSGMDWYLNETGLMVVETTIDGQEEKNPEGIPVFVRIRTAVQYAESIDQFLEIMTTGNNGAYADEWLIGDAKTGEIASLQLGTTVWDINRTFNGFFGSSNYTWGTKLREAIGVEPPDPTSGSYARYIRWGQLKDKYYGKIDVEIGKLMLSDHYDTLLRRNAPSSRTICGHKEDETVGEARLSGAQDGKVTSSNLALDGMSMWGRSGHPCGTPFHIDEFVEAYPEWAETHPLELEYIRAFNQPNPWTFFGKER